MLYLIIYARDCKPDSKLQPEFSNPFSLSTASQKLILRAMILTTVCVTDRIETGWRHIQWSAVDHRADHLQIFGCGRKNSVLFSADKALRNPLKKRSDHSFYHRQTRNMRKQWTKNAPRASALERKRYESTQSARDDEPTSVGVVETAGSSPVTRCA